MALFPPLSKNQYSVPRGGTGTSNSHMAKWRQRPEGVRHRTFRTTLRALRARGIYPFNYPWPPKGGT